MIAADFLEIIKEEIQENKNIINFITSSKYYNINRYCRLLRIKIAYYIRY
uniref:Uncharacterized protein n=1 Tax=Tolypiocladia glomerulata TaxID=860646 RepID=A0A1Z1MUY9_9FLOR|nr:hypothetical protein [Tolypiocladia glomerulata]ARW69689.1 hypothetical protein [Tolypiocladia glomerulata]